MKETHYKLKHRVTALFAAAVMLCSMLPSAAFAEEPAPQPTEEVVQMEQQTEPSETDNGQTDESSPDPGAEVDAPEAEPVQEEKTDATEASAADEPEQPITEETPSEEINNLSDFVFSAIKAIGAILLGFGIVQIGLALKGHDASQRAQGFMTFFGGVVIYFAKDILDMIL